MFFAEHAPVFKLVLLFFAGIAGGFFNVNAGGGSMITIPALIFFGLDSTMANGTNRIALLFQNVSSVTTYQRKGYFEPKLVARLAVPAAVGSLIGARVGVTVPDHLFRILLSAVMVIVILVTVFQPHKLLKQQTGFSQGRMWALMIAFLFVGFYGGFVQVGVGFVIITVITMLTPFNLVRTNSIKVFVVGIYMVSSLIVYIASGKVQWLPGLVLAGGNSLGAWVGTLFSVKKGDRWIRVIFLIAATAMAIKVSGLADSFF